MIKLRVIKENQHLHDDKYCWGVTVTIMNEQFAFCAAPHLKSYL